MFKKTLIAFLFMSSLANTLSEQAEASVSVKGTVTADTLNIRNKPTTYKSFVTGKLKKNHTVNILSEKNNWATISYNGKTGYVHTAYLKISRTTAPTKISTTSVNTPTATPYSVQALVKESLNVRNKPTSYKSSVLGKLSKNSKVTLLSEKNNWATISYNGKTGYVHTAYLSTLNKTETGLYILKLNGKFPYYTSPALESKTKTTLPPRLILSAKHYGQWFEIQTTVGTRWINIKDGKTEIKLYSKADLALQINKPLNLYNGPFNSAKSSFSVPADSFNAIAQVGNWYKIETKYGNKWVYVTPKDSTAVSIEKTTFDLETEQQENVYTHPFEETKTNQVLKKQKVTVIGKTGNWHQIKLQNETGWIYYIAGETDAPQTPEPGTTTTEPTPEPVSEPVTTYKLIYANGTEKTFTDKALAQSAFESATGDRYLTENAAVIDMSRGYAQISVPVTATANIYNSANGTAMTYVSTQTQMNVTDVTEDRIYIRFDGVDGYIKKTDATLIPFYSGNRSYFRRSGSDLLYHINGASYGVMFSKAPSTLVEGTKYFTFDNFTINNQPVYQYYNYLSVRSESGYTAAELDSYIKSVVADSPLIGKTQYFINAAQKYNLNTLYLLAHAIHESNWGRSSIARDKNNFFGISAYDSDAYNSATGFETPELGIEKGAEWISKNYGTPTDFRYVKGMIVGNKGAGMNVKYASDPFWGVKIAGHMYRADKMLGYKDYKKYTIGLLPKGTVLYKVTDTEKITLYALPTDRFVAVNKTITNAQGTFLEIVSDESYRQYVYAPTDKIKYLSVY